jgi:hypothetical protein
MQACVITTRCDILLEGREQFVGHMKHGHDASFEQADVVWKSMPAATQKSA